MVPAYSQCRSMQQTPNPRRNLDVTIKGDTFGLRIGRQHRYKRAKLAINRAVSNIAWHASCRRAEIIHP